VPLPGVAYLVLLRPTIMTKYHIFFIATVSFLISTVRAPAADQPPAPTTDQNQVTEAMHSFFAAATADDRDKLHAVTTSDFYAFDAGGRFTRDGLMDLIKAAHAEGKVYVWTVNGPEVHISGDIAWITYANQGSRTDASGTKDMNWLESAVLQKEKGVWRIRFFHSTLLPEKK
jgi:ketosteroid isomerase-like protein